MPVEWIMIRVLRATHARLCDARESMRLGADLGLRELDCDSRDRVSLDQIIGLLLDARDRHRERKRRSARARRRRHVNETEIHNHLKNLPAREE